MSYQPQLIKHPIKHLNSGKVLHLSKLKRFGYHSRRILYKLLYINPQHIYLFYYLFPSADKISLDVRLYPTAEDACKAEHILSEQTLEKIRERAIETDAELGKTVK